MSAPASLSPAAMPSVALPRAPGSQINPLTCLRFFAALIVVLFHLRVMHILSGGPWWYQNFASIGYIGVNCFFVLSGFILVYTYGTSTLHARQFWRARFARIYPAYLVSLLISAPSFFHAVAHLDIAYLAWSKQHLTAASILTLGLLQAWLPQGALTWNAVCWSLSAEAFFYLLFPGLLLWVRRLTPRSLVLGIAACSLLSLTLSTLYLFLHPDGIDKINSPETTLLWKNVLSYNPAARLPEFITGMLAGQMFLASRGNPARSNRKAALLLVSLGLGMLIILTGLVGKIPNPLISAGFLSPAFAAIIYGLALPVWSTSFLEYRGLVLLGEASYSLYLLHSFVISRVYDATSVLPAWLRVSACLIAAVAASLICFSLVEQPARKLLRQPPRRGSPFV